MTEHKHFYRGYNIVKRNNEFVILETIYMPFNTIDEAFKKIDAIYSHTSPVITNLKINYKKR